MTGDPPFECGPECPAPDHHTRQGHTSARVHVEAMGTEPGQIYAGESHRPRQAQLIEATAHDVAVIQDIKDMYLADGWPAQAAEASQWLAAAQQDHAAAVAGIDYRDLAAMGTESVMTEPEPCGYPGDLEPEAAL